MTKKPPKFTEEQIDYLEDLIFNEMVIIGGSLRAIIKKGRNIETALKILDNETRQAFNNMRKSSK